MKGKEEKKKNQKVLNSLYIIYIIKGKKKECIISYLFISDNFIYT